jgi:hypothetical protein
VSHLHQGCYVRHMFSHCHFTGVYSDLQFDCVQYQTVVMLWTLVCMVFSIQLY